MKYNISRKAFTLIELTIVMVLISIMSVLFVTRIIESSRLNFGVSLASIRDHLRFASDYAISKGVTTVVSFNVAGNSYSVYQQDALGVRTLLKNPEDGQDFIIKLGQDVYKGVTLTGVVINGTSELKFTDYGVPLDANSVKLAGTAYIQINSLNAIAVYPVSSLCKVML
jgi:prepilin-type N-terminal cleavage/methylation domain-containing protein